MVAAYQSYLDVDAYTPVARTLHWITAALVLALIPIGLTMVNMPEGPAQNFLFELHKSLGATVLPVILLRLFYRLTHPPAPLPADIPELQKLAAHANHWGFYGLLIVQPLLG